MSTAFKNLIKFSVSSAILSISTVLSSNAIAQNQNQAVEKQPNILFILADDHRWDLIGKTHPIIKTPNLDELANQGAFFKNAFVTTPICASSRVSILTGLTERTHDFTFGQPKTGMLESEQTYPQILKQNGYLSAFVGKYEIKLSGEASDRFDYYKPLLQSKTNEYKGKTLPQTYYIAELAMDFIEQSKAKNKPWTMSVNFWNPHAHDRDTQDQYHYPAEFESYYQDVTIPPAKFSDDKTFNDLPEFLQQSIGRVRWEYRFGSEEIYQKMVKRHYRAISAVDKAVGRIVNKLEEAGVADNTVIIYTGDNGYSINERQLAGKWFGWEEDLRVPLIIYDPRKQTSVGTEPTEMALNIDIAPTILNLAGVQSPSHYQGESLTSIVNGKSPANWRNEFFFEHMYQPKRVSIPPTIGLRTESWKFVDFYKNDFKQLYDLRTDPQEEHNLAYKPAYQAKLQALEARTAQYVNQYETERSDEVKKRQSFKNAQPKQ